AERITRAPLYGIIGDAGALGVFAGGKYGADGSGADSPLIGGFEVSPNPVPTASYQVFEDYFSGLAVPDERRINSKIGEYSTLLKGTATGLVQDFISPANFNFYAQRSDQTHAECRAERNCNILISSVVRLGENPRSNSGFVIMTQFGSEHPGGDTYAGLLSGTNLGAILPVSFGGGATKAIWHGSIYHSEDSIEISRGVERLIHRPLSLTVDLSAGTLQTVDLLGRLGAFVLSPTSSVTIDGRFGLHPSAAKEPYGLLFGTVTYNGFPYKLAGLIGVEGAIGVFAFETGATPGNSDINGNMNHGGFQVSPPPPPAYGHGNYTVFDDFYHRSKSNT
ncbi:MAG: hypothetical protein K8953_08480, partial [Proteobacteria bacterium]|nr:hypothetical protein [Pseudomonadota bacterium]